MLGMRGNGHAFTRQTVNAEANCWRGYAVTLRMKRYVRFKIAACTTSHHHSLRLAAVVRDSGFWHRENAFIMFKTDSLSAITKASHCAKPGKKGAVRDHWPELDVL
eukprot:4072141-Amphidinium_carterae.1